MTAYFWVCVGSALGGGLRFWISGWIAERYGGAFPWGTLWVNVSGSLVIGFLGALSNPDGRFLLTPAARQLLMVGVLGGYTTFSSFSLQTLNLIQDGEWLQAAANVLLSVSLCLVAVWAGDTAGDLLNIKR
jgi:CrcB protein